MIAKLLLQAVISCTLIASVSRMKLEEIQAKTNLLRVRGNKDVLYQWSHVVYCDDTFYYKIWDTNDKRESLFLHAYQTKLFHGVTPLHGLIFDKNKKLRGYCTKMCSPIKQMIDYFPSSNKNIKYWASFENQPPQLQELILKIRKKFTTTKYLFFDLVPHNFGSINGKIYLFDLDSIIHLEKLNQNIVKKSKGSHLFYTPKQLSPFYQTNYTK